MHELDLRIARRIEALKRAVGVDVNDGTHLLNFLSDAELSELFRILERHFPRSVPENSEDWDRALAIIGVGDERRAAPQSPPDGTQPRTR